jgi:prepilin-type N-terminal cleavage/methylation domain-containing protein
VRRRPPGAVRRDDGFTIVEVLASLAVIGIVLLAVTTFFVRSMATVRLQGARQAAIQIAASNMEQLRALAGPSAVTWLTNRAAEAPADAGTSSSVIYQQKWAWTWSCSITPTSGCPVTPLDAIAVVPLLAQATVTITWRGRDCPVDASGRCSYKLATQLSLSTSEPVFTS